MAERILYPEYRDELEATRYPFADNATLRSRTGILLPPSLFLDASFYVPETTQSCYLSSITVTTQTLEFTIGTPTNPVVATATADARNLPDHLTFYDEYGFAAGLIVSEAGRLGTLLAWPQDRHVFAPEATPFAASCVFPSPGVGVRSIALGEKRLVGDVWLVGGDGVAFRIDENPQVKPHIVINLVGDALFLRRRCACDPHATLPWTVRKINNMQPDEYGNIFLVRGHRYVEDSILRIDPINGGLRISLVGTEETGD